MYRQLELPLSRFEQRDILREMQLKSFGKRGQVAGAITQKAILKELMAYGEKFGACFASLTTLAEAVGCSKKTIQNGLNALEAQRLIMRVKPSRENYRGARSNQYIIDWGEVGLLANRMIVERRETSEIARPAVDSEQVARIADQVATNAEHVATDSDQVATNVDQLATVTTEVLKEKEQRENTNETDNETELDWLFVREVLISFRLKKADEAITKAKERGLGIDQAFSLMTYYQTIHDGAELKDLRGHLFNWFVDAFSAPPKALQVITEHTPAKFVINATKLKAILQKLLQDGMIEEHHVESRLTLARCIYDLGRRRQYRMISDTEHSEKLTELEISKREFEEMVNAEMNHRATPATSEVIS